MANIEKLFDKLESIVLNLTYTVRIQGDTSFMEPTSVYLVKMDNHHPVFKAGDTIFTLNIEEDFEIVTPEPPLFNHLFLLKPKDDEEYLLQCLPCRETTPMENTYKLCFSNELINKLRKENINKVSSKYHNYLVFKAGDYEILIIDYFHGNKDFAIFGLDSQAIVQPPSITDSKRWKGKFINRDKEFKDYILLCHKKIEISINQEIEEESSALDLLDKQGNTILSIWAKYAELEREQAEKISEELGCIQFKRLKRDTDHHVELSLRFDDGLDDRKQENIFNGLASKGTIFSISDEYFKLLSYDRRKKTATFLDELLQIPEKGELTLSTMGDEKIQERRVYARNTILKFPTPLMLTLRQVIEGRPLHNSTFNRKHRTISPSTEEFLRTHYEIEKLTDDQREAIEIAINTPDIVAIQGPPGTGKTTVFAAICHELEVIAKQRRSSKQGNGNKLILLSAFQNDTVEHAASKVYSNGLPTDKVSNKESLHLAALSLKNDIHKRIRDVFMKLNPGDLPLSICSKFKDVKSVLEEDNDLDSAICSINKILEENQFSQDLVDEWRAMTNGSNTMNRRTARKLHLLKNIDYTKSWLEEEENRVRIYNAISSYNNISETFLDTILVGNFEVSFIEELKDVVNEVIRETNLEHNNHITLQDIEIWLSDAIDCAQTWEDEIITGDEATFVCSVLQEIKNELATDTLALEQVIRKYGKSIAATNQYAAKLKDYKIQKVDNVILEEAARSNPLDLLIPMTMATERIILVGDHKQLPHLVDEKIADIVVNSNNSDAMDAEEKEELLHMSLFNIIYDNLAGTTPQRRITLTEQFRMHPAIGDFVSRTYYDGNLKNGLGSWEKQAAQKKHCLSLPWAKGKAIVFADVPYTFERRELNKRHSWYRPAEIDRLFDLLKQIMEDPKSRELTIGIISFYSQQVQQIFERAKKEGYVEDIEGEYRIAEEYRFTPDSRKEKFRIGSVDAFQGKEFDIIILSTVRSNETERTKDKAKSVFGFLMMENRLNVAFSRAQRLLIAVGDGKMFSDTFAKEHVKGLHDLYVEETSKEHGNII